MRYYQFGASYFLNGTSCLMNLGRVLCGASCPKPFQTVLKFILSSLPTLSRGLLYCEICISPNFSFAMPPIGDLHYFHFGESNY